MGVRLLIVEGSSDRWFVSNLLMRNDFEKVETKERRDFVIRKRGVVDADFIQIVVANGFDRIGRQIRDSYRPDEMTGLGIVADMDLASDNRYLELRRILEAERFRGIPDQIGVDGLVVDEAASGCLGVWLMPDNLGEGMTETFAAQLFADADPGWAHAQAVVSNLPDHARSFDPVRHSDKARIHTWLAWQEDPGGSLGDAVLRGYLDVNGALADRFCAWVDRWLAAGSGGGVG